MKYHVATGVDSVYYSIGEFVKPKYLGELIGFDIQDNCETVEIDIPYLGRENIVTKNIYNVTIEIPSITEENRIDFFGSSKNTDGSLRLSSLKRPKINFYIIQNFNDGKDYITLWDFVVLSSNIGGSTKNEGVTFSTVQLNIKNTKNDCIDIKSIYSEDDVKPLFEEDEDFYLQEIDSNPTYRKSKEGDI